MWHPGTDFGGFNSYSIRVSRRESLLIEEGVLYPYEIYKRQREESITLSKISKEIETHERDK